MTLNVLMWAPTPSPSGGHKVQMQMTAAHLNQIDDVTVTQSYDQGADLADFDLVHGFGLSPGDARRARSAGKPLLLSTIYWPKEYRNKGVPAAHRYQEIGRRLRTAAGLTLAGLRGRHHEKSESYSRWIIETRATYEIADYLLPNSTLEAQAIQNDLGVTTPYWVIPNGADPDLYYSSGTRSRSGVLMVGRIEPHKNQLTLIRACRELDLELTIVGEQPPDHKQYSRQCVAESGPKVTILPAMKPAELRGVYDRSQVHALPSYFETTGLVSLEAALTGCVIVSTSRGYAREYFKDQAEYCDPQDVSSVRTALVKALTLKPSTALRERILEQFTWHSAAQATLSAYQHVATKS